MTTACRLLDVPTEILWAIFDYIGDSHPRSLLSLALVNKRHYSAASPFLYRSLTFQVDNPEQLTQDAQRCELLLRRDSAFPHVRRLIVHGRLGLEPPQGSHSPTLSPTPSPPRAAPELAVSLADEGLGRQRMPCAKLVGSLYHEYNQSSLAALNRVRRHHHDASAQQVHQSGPYWTPLARLIDILPAMTDFVFACPDQLPPCVLEALHRHSARPRLHMCAFALRSLADAEIDPHEVALASSPLLHRIFVYYEDTNGYDLQSRPSYHFNAVMDLVTGVAPNLREVRLFHSSGESEDEHGISLPLPPAWKGFPTDTTRFNKGEENRRSLGSLESLDLEGNNDLIDESPRHLTGDAIRRWERCTDFSALRTLNLHQSVTQEALDSLTEHCRFPNLTSLVLNCDDTSTPERAELVRRFLCSLANLRSLELQARSFPVQGLGAAAFSPGLTTLRLPTAPETSYHEVLPSIIQRCPMIEYLSVAIPRHRGGAPEVRLYRAIGSLPRLQRLTLALDASGAAHEAQHFVPRHAEVFVPQPDDELESTFTHGWVLGLPKRAVYNALIDSAVDEKLALAIFQAVSLGKNNATTPAVPLESLLILVQGGERIVRTATDPTGQPLIMATSRRGVLRPYLNNMGRTWRVKRDPRDDRRGVLHAVEMGGKARRQSDTLHQPRNWQRNSTVLPVFRRIWPEKAPGSEWFDDWDSLPLERLGDEEE
ncbi:hypothetical protein B0I37DRAFT_409406 [Chaetomium sp. MPI-CAGE-AT-0009]|nr:hypothetical protein B0I37DRAFT_409406 [Chaetomium sp. MPI-CAGE-AT-0009]